ncbi:MAG: hypothetical protein JST08_15220 [Actinobacteria bacterium]|nr:hypothetical protein [Actinomycetota bacterium]
MKRTDKAIALALLLGVITAAIAALGAGPAGAAEYTTGFKTAKFKVEVKGTQDSELHLSREAEGPCGVSDFSIGREHLTFHTTKPVVITAIDTPGGGFNPEFFAGRRLAIPTAATVDRSFTPVISAPHDPECGENGGADPGSEPTRPDCGRRKVKFPVNLQYGRNNHDGLLLSSGLTDERFYNECPSPASIESFPWLLVEDTAGKYIYAQLTQKELFDPNYRKWISIARGSRKVTSSNEWRKTTIRWEVSFTRLGK